MTRDDIIKLVRQHGKPVQEQNAEVEYLFTLEGIGALLSAERERLARLAESREDNAGYHSLSATEIRAGRIGA